MLKTGKNDFMAKKLLGTIQPKKNTEKFAFWLKNVAKGSVVEYQQFQTIDIRDSYSRNYQLPIDRSNLLSMLSLGFDSSFSFQSYKKIFKKMKSKIKMKENQK